MLQLLPIPNALCLWHKVITTRDFMLNAPLNDEKSNQSGSEIDDPDRDM